MNLKLSEEVNEIISYSKEEAIRLGNKAMSTDHFFLGILRQERNGAVGLLVGFDIDVKNLKKDVEDLVRSGELLGTDDTENLFLTKSAEKALRQIYLEARAMQSPEPLAIHLLLSILSDENAYSTQALNNLGLDYQLAKAKLNNEDVSISPKSSYTNDDDEDDDSSSAPQGSSQGFSPATKGSSETPVVDNFSVDLTKAAIEDRLDPIVGREKEIERMAQILTRRKKNNPVLIGEPGVGKSAIAEGLAIRIVQKKVPRILLNKRVLSLDIASIVAGTKYRGQFEERMKAILTELSKASNIILFIDEIHTLVGAGGATGSLDAANMLKPALARGEIQCIGATTLDEYREHIEKDGALERRFQKIMVEPTSVQETVEILNNIKERYENHHNVIYTPDALKACVLLTQRYITDRFLPDKAIDALDEAGARVHISNIDVPENISRLEHELEEVKANKLSAVKLQDFEKAAEYRNTEKSLQNELSKAQEEWEKEMSKNRQIVDEEKVAEVVAMMTNVPVQRIAQAEGSRLLKMSETLKGSVVGQNEAVEKVVKAIQRNRAGLKDPNRPIGTFIFLGPTGVGKTQLAKVLTQYLFDSTDNLIRIDMSEYMEKFAVSRLVGAPPGYVGYEEGGQLTEKVRRRPYSVVLLDEIEKAHPDVFNILLQLLDEGVLTDSLGRKVDFKNTIIIMTSNIGSRELKEFGQGVGFATVTKREQTISENTRSIIEKSLRRTFAPEFLNRIDDTVVFNTLSKENIFEIIDIELKGLFKRILELGYTIELSTDAKNFIAEQGFDIQFGARPLKRAIQKNLEDPLAEAIIRDEVKAGQTLQVELNADKNGIIVNVKTEVEKEVEVE